MIAKIKHWAKTNALNKSMKKKIMEEIRGFTWRGKEKQPRVRWEVMIQKPEEGGIGIKDPISTLDAEKVGMLVRLMTRDRQPWMRWVERKLKRVAERWGVEEAMAAKPKKKQLDELREGCVVESTLKLWHEIGGAKREAREVTRKIKKEEVTKRERRDLA